VPAADAATDHLCRPVGILGGYFVSVIQLGIQQPGLLGLQRPVRRAVGHNDRVAQGIVFRRGDRDDRLLQGIQLSGRAQGVGEACTEAFVGSFISILVINFIYAVVVKSIFLTFWPIKSLL